MTLSNSQPMCLLKLEQYSDKQKRAMKRVLDSLDSLEKRMNNHYSGQRAHERKDYRGIVWISVPNDDPTIGSSFNSVQVWSRSISQSGISFIYPFPIYQSTILVGIPVSSDQTTWFRSEIVRQREFEEEQFWEYGVKFVGKATT